MNTTLDELATLGRAETAQILLSTAAGFRQELTGASTADEITAALFLEAILKRAAELLNEPQNQPHDARTCEEID